MVLFCRSELANHVCIIFIETIFVMEMCLRILGAMIVQALMSSIMEIHFNLLVNLSFISITRNRMAWQWAETLVETRTTRTPAFWGYPPPPHDYPYHWVILDPKSKEDRVKVTNLKNSPKFQIFKQPLHATHHLKLLDKMCKYEMDPMSIVEDTERTRFCPQTDGWTRWNQYTPLSTSLKRGV